MADEMCNGRSHDGHGSYGSMFFSRGFLDGGFIDDDDDDRDDQLIPPDEIDAAQMLNGMIEGVVQRGGNAVRRWCFANNIPPSEMIDEALGFLLAGILGSASDPSELEVNDELAEQSMRNTQAMIAELMPEMQADLAIAMRQVQQFMQQFDSPEKMIEALGLPEDPADDEA